MSHDQQQTQYSFSLLEIIVRRGDFNVEMEFRMIATRGDFNVEVEL
mgnify:CR=1 FL=1